MCLFFHRRAKRKMAKGAKSNYSGVLIRPIEHRGWQPTFVLGPTFEESDVYKEQFYERWIALFQHYGISPMEPEAMTRMAHCLAFEHVPGFNTRPTKTKSKKWNYQELMKLRLLINTIRARNDDGTLRSERLDATLACKILAKRRQKDRTSAVLSPGSLRRLYVEANKLREERLTRRLARWDVIPGVLGRAKRRARLSHPYWKTRLAAGDTEALRQKQLQSVQTIASGMGAVFGLGAGWEEI